MNEIQLRSNTLLKNAILKRAMHKHPVQGRAKTWSSKNVLKCIYLHF